ncbi:phenoloxidase-activating factor 2-like [Episyrphus balteatus]|uniref:phenoloxidase-activating factor 2-like n=1 Tax=Episyrphus balteatus TaxID=286459 RepID=UPI002485F959|nr:phenoloxidase-activating factor 2-like [Episyrphus balteatus]
MNAKLILIPVFLIGLCEALVVDQALLDSIFVKNFQPVTVDPFLIESVFTTTEGPVTSSAVTQKPVTHTLTGNSYQPCGPTKACVRQYLCKNGKVNKDGATIFDIRIDRSLDDSKDLCNNALETCCDTGEMVSMPILSQPTLIGGCGYRNANGVGIKIKEAADNEAEFGEFPWMVGILNKTILNGKLQSVLKCGGSLIAPTVVLTGGHCVFNTEAQNLEVRAGEWESNSNAEPYPHQDRQVVEIIVHESFNDRNLRNNIALLFLETPFDEMPHINTICLPPAGTNFDMSRCFASGWGKTKFGIGKYPNILKKIDLPVVSNDKCQNDLRKTRLGRYFELHSSFMCAGGERDKDTCQGDGGSPLVCPMVNTPDRYYQVGIVSWGIGCGDENVPGVYASIPKLRSWIDEKLTYKNIDAEFFTP